MKLMLFEGFSLRCILYLGIAKYVVEAIAMQ